MYTLPIDKFAAFELLASVPATKPPARIVTAETVRAQIAALSADCEQLFAGDDNEISFEYIGEALRVIDRALVTVGVGTIDDSDGVRGELLAYGFATMLDEFDYDWRVTTPASMHAKLGDTIAAAEQLYVHDIAGPVFVAALRVLDEAVSAPDENARIECLLVGFADVIDIDD